MEKDEMPNKDYNKTYTITFDTEEIKHHCKERGQNITQEKAEEIAEEFLAYFDETFADSIVEYLYY